MKALSTRWFWGLVLIVGGILLLLDTFGVFKGGALFWTIALAVAGVLFLSIFFSNHQQWWALIPGVTFLAIAITMGLSSFLPGFSAGSFAGTIILGGIALSFLLVFIAERSNWWAIIPAGVMATIAIVAIVDTNGAGSISGGIFFLGLGITFALVAMIPPTAGQMRWAWIPAAVLGLMGILILLTAEKLINYIWPSALVVAGLFMLWRSLRRK